MDIVKLNKLNLLKKEFEEFVKQSKTLDRKNSWPEHKVEILKGPHDACEWNCLLFFHYK